MNRVRRRLAVVSALVAIVGFGLYLRYTEIGAGLPYIYQDDEGHHFTRVVTMVKRGSYDPDYFNKPSLHFYLRMPVVAVAYVWAVKQGDLTSLRSFETVDRFPDGERDYVVSHPRIAVWSRAFSVFLSLVLVVVTFLIARQLTGSDALALAAAWFSAVAPALVGDAPKIGVDTLMALMSLLAIYVALRIGPAPTRGGLFLAGLVAGLAVSSKYNAAPIVAVPVIVSLMTRPRAAGPVCAALCGAAAGFLIGTPYSVLRLPAFLDDVAFEVRHYGELGHGANTGEPGWDQVRFYGKWLATWGAGYGVTVLGAIGLGLLAARRTAQSLQFLTFPVLFFLLMIDQKVNFPRNILVLIPVLSIGAAAVLQAIPARIPRRAAIVGLLVILASVQPVRASLRLRSNAAALAPDSRARAIAWLMETGPDLKTAATPDLRLPRAMLDPARIVELKRPEIGADALATLDVDRLVTSYTHRFAAEAHGYRIERIFPGARTRDKIPVNPEVVVFRVRTAGTSDGPSGGS